MAVLRLKFPRGRELTGSLLFGLFNFGGAFALACYGLVEVHAGLGQILLAVVPLATLMLAVVEGQEKLRMEAVVGTVLALVGIALVSGAPLGQSVPLTSLLALVGSAACFAQAAVLVRRFPPVHPVTMNAVGMATGAAVLLAASLVADGRISDFVPFKLPDRSETWLALLYVVVVGSILVFCSTSSSSRAGAPPVVGGLLAVAGVYIGALRPAAMSALRAQSDR